MDFPEWAPKDLCDYYNWLAKLKPRDLDRQEREDLTPEENFRKRLLGRRLADETIIPAEKEDLIQAKKLLERLLTNETMIPVWEAFAAQKANPARHHENCYTPLPPAYFWLLKLSIILHYYRQSGEKFLSRKEIIEKLRRIVKGANELSRALKDTPLDGSPFRWLNESEKGEILEKIKIEHIVPKSFLLCSGSYDRSSPPDRDAVFTHTLKRSIPLSSTTSTIMKGIANKAKEELKIFQGETEIKMYPVISNSGSKNARANYFIRAMSEYFKDSFGSPRYRLLGRLASVVMDDPEIDETTVRSSLNEWRKSQSKNP
jgi:hypothetical protein